MAIDLERELRIFLLAYPNTKYKDYLSDLVAGKPLLQRGDNTRLIRSINSMITETEMTDKEKEEVYKEISDFFKYINSRHNTGFFIEDHLFSIALDKVERRLNIIKQNHGRNHLQSSIELQQNVCSNINERTVRRDTSGVIEGFTFMGVHFNMTDSDCLENTRHPIVLNLSFDELYFMYKFYQEHLTKDDTILKGIINKFSSQLSEYAKQELENKGMTLEYCFDNFEANKELERDNISLRDKIYLFHKRRIPCVIKTKFNETFEADKIDIQGYDVITNKTIVKIEDIISIKRKLR